MAELVSPYRHYPAYGVVQPRDQTTLKIVSAETIDIVWTFNVGNNGTQARYGDQYFLLSQNIGGYNQKKLVEYAPSEGKVYDFFEEEFGVSSSIYPSWPVAVGPEPMITGYEIPVHYGLPKTYFLQIPGPMAGTTAQSGYNRPLYDWWQEVARRQSFAYLNMEFGYYQLDNDKNLESQILPKADLPKPWEVLAGDQPTHKVERLFKVLWEEER